MAARAKPSKLDADGLWNYALRLLRNRAHSAGELKQKLSARADSAAELDATLLKLRAYGFTEDRKFSENFAAAQLEKGFGPARVLRDLRQRRVAPPLAERAVKQIFAEVDERQLVESFLARKYRGKDLPQFLGEDKNLAGVYRRLRTAGFKGRTVLEVLKRYRNIDQDFEEPE